MILAGFCQMGKAQDGYVGEIRLFAGSFAPVGWYFCEGQVLDINQHMALYSLIGTTYNYTIGGMKQGDGVATFALPDLRNKLQAPTGQNQSVNTPVKYIICHNGIYPQRP